MSSQYKFFYPTKDNPARGDTYRIGNSYIDYDIKENFRNREKFREMRRLESSFFDIWNALYETYSLGTNIGIDGIDKVEAKEMTIGGKNRKTINFSYMKGDYPFKEKQLIDGVLYSQIELSLPKYCNGKTIAVDLDSDISQNEVILELINSCRDKKFKFLDSWDINYDFSENYFLKRVDLYLDSWHDSKSEQQVFLDEICNKRAPTGYNVNVVAQGQTLKIKPTNSLGKDVPTITIYNKTKQAREKFNVFVPGAITRLEERFDKTQIENSNILKNINITTDKISNGNWKPIDLNVVFNNVFKKYSPAKYYVKYLSKTHIKVSPKYVYSHWDISMDIFNIIYNISPNGIGFNDLVKRLSGKYSENTINRVIKMYLKSGILEKKRKCYYLSKDGYSLTGSFLNFFERRKVS